MRPGAVAASKVGVDEHSDRGVQIRVVAVPNPDFHADRLEPEIGRRSGMSPDVRLLDARGDHHEAELRGGCVIALVERRVGSVRECHPRV
jgi:hypothetical protein